MKQRQPTSRKERSEEELKARAVMVDEAKSLYGDDLEKYVCSLARGAESIDPDDIVQSVWMAVLNNFRDEQILQKKLLIVKAKCQFYDALRKRDSRRRKESSFMSHLKANVPRSTRALIFGENAGNAKKQFWEKYSSIDLTEQQKEVIWMHVIEDLTFAEIQTIAGVPKSTASGWMSSCREKFKLEREKNPELFTDIPSHIRLVGFGTFSPSVEKSKQRRREPSNEEERLLSKFESRFCFLCFGKETF